MKLNLAPAQATKVRQVLQALEKTPRHELNINYDSCNPFVVCGSTFTPIYQGSEDVSEDVSCPFRAARFVPQVRGQGCPVCDVATVGADPSGLIFLPTQQR